MSTELSTRSSGVSVWYALYFEDFVLVTVLLAVVACIDQLATLFLHTSLFRKDVVKLTLLSFLQWENWYDLMHTRWWKIKLYSLLTELINGLPCLLCSRHTKGKSDEPMRLHGWYLYCCQRFPSGRLETSNAGDAGLNKSFRSLHLSYLRPKENHLRKAESRMLARRKLRSCTNMKERLWTWWTFTSSEARQHFHFIVCICRKLSLGEDGSFATDSGHLVALCWTCIVRIYVSRIKTSKSTVLLYGEVRYFTSTFTQTMTFLWSSSWSYFFHLLEPTTTSSRSE